ncbi:PfkB family carbohydrate kinase [Kytococcus sedentarius]|uniref:PfkB family carbohydrate kinase n=1 Tax=Kytococcus sedentarius TaxID=1276 RepID=UPI0035BBC0D3
MADTVGAGDSFMAGLLSALLDAGLLGTGAGAAAARSHPGWHSLDTVHEAVARGLTTGAWTVQRAGAGGPSRAELRTA